MNVWQIGGLGSECLAFRRRALRLSMPVFSNEKIEVGIKSLSQRCNKKQPCDTVLNQLPPTT